MNNNIYYIVDADDENINEITDVCVGTAKTQRYNLIKTKLVIKLCAGDIRDYPFLKKYKHYNNKKILVALDNNEWREPVGPIE